MTNDHPPSPPTMSLRRSPLVAPVLCTLLPCLQAAPAPEKPGKKNVEVTAVFANVAPDYQRPLQDDGRPARETYAFGEGGLLNDRTNDRSVDDMKFNDAERDKLHLKIPASADDMSIRAPRPKWELPKLPSTSER